MKETRHFIGAKTTKQKMFEAISLPGELQKWWATTAKGIPETGETLELYFHELTTLKFRYTEMIPSEKLVLTCHDGFGPWQDTVLTFEIEEKDDQVFLTHIHDNIIPEDVEALTYFSSKWTIYLLSLKNLLENGTGTPFPKEIKLYHGD
ncbi:SRPBCC domain-containing protein [Fulvivirgaceae bacterium BMA12]|uniref:SRPBCC domain-containing protein n=1 Tax=Agaribacillus aureus TaxID=3051825 RepID=A0ABT8L1M6_9BACT|nr:SRPBCC domain-containing protein [Fulvivirgaceae bacterium BMA12]